MKAINRNGDSPEFLAASIILESIENYNNSPDFIEVPPKIDTPTASPIETHKQQKSKGRYLKVKNRLTALNIETGVVHRITKELYHSRRDIYFIPVSKVFKEWKAKQTSVNQ